MYYLQSRYYDPALKRFINTDGFVSTGQAFLGYNMFSYCLNNPTNYSDHSGNDCICLHQRVRGDHVCSDYIPTHKSVFGATSSVSYTQTVREYDYYVPFIPIRGQTGIKETTSISSGQAGYITAYYDASVNNPYKSSTSGISFTFGSWQMKLTTGMDNLGLSFFYIDGNTTTTSTLSANLSELTVGFESSVTVKWDNISEKTYARIDVDIMTLVLGYLGISSASNSSSTTPTPAYAH